MLLCRVSSFAGSDGIESDGELYDLDFLFAGEVAGSVVSLGLRKGWLGVMISRWGWTYFGDR